LADELRGYYRDQKNETKKADAANPLGMLGGGGSMELYRLEAIGNVHIETADQQAQGDQAFYDLDQSVFSLTGKNLGMKSATGTVTATDSLEYWQHKQMAVARGNAVVVQGTNRVAADVVTAYFAPDQTGANSLARAEAVNNVRIQARAALAQGDRAVYDLHQGIATIQGNVRLTQGNNQMNGDYAEVNMNTGVSKLLASQDGSARRVQGLIVPQKAKNIKPAAVQ
jgi:lipopolysaccharide export system protein LptA